MQYTFGAFGFGPVQLAFGRIGSGRRGPRPGQVAGSGPLRRLVVAAAQVALPEVRRDPGQRVRRVVGQLRVVRVHVFFFFSDFGDSISRAGTENTSTARTRTVTTRTRRTNDVQHVLGAATEKRGDGPVALTAGTRLTAAAVRTDRAVRTTAVRRRARTAPPPYVLTIARSNVRKIAPPVPAHARFSALPLSAPPHPHRQPVRRP